MSSGIAVISGWICKNTQCCWTAYLPKQTCRL